MDLCLKVFDGLFLRCNAFEHSIQCLTACASLQLDGNFDLMWIEALKFQHASSI